jgi:hypothetical protein
MTEPDRLHEPRPITALRSVVGEIAAYVADLLLCSTSNAPEWLRRIPIPTGWQLAQFEGQEVAPTRTAVCGQRSAGGWDGCDTVSLYTFSGSVPLDLIREANDWTLRDMSAESVTTRPLVTPCGGSVGAVRSSGYLTLSDRRLWAQYSTYCLASRAPGSGVLLLHNVFVGADVRGWLRNDIAELSDVVHTAFLALTDTVDDDPPTTPMPALEGDHDGP